MTNSSVGNNQFEVPHEVRAPVDEELLHFSMKMAKAISNGQMETRPVQAKKVRLVDVNGVVDEVQVEDNLYSRVLHTIYAEIANIAPDQAQGVLHRILMIESIINDADFSEWVNVNDGEGCAYVDERLIDAVATCTITPDGTFPKQAILEELNASTH